MVRKERKGNAEGAVTKQNLERMRSREDAPAID